MITVYDTATGSLNIGDYIIMEAAKRELNDMFKDEIFDYFATHKVLTREELNRAWINSLAFVCGTNLLRGSWRFKAVKNQWSISFFDGFKMQPAILLGVGWNNYRKKTKLRAKIFYRNALRKDILHSVRDNYTKEKLALCGIHNVINTGCPTLWGLDDNHLSTIPKAKSGTVVFTLTDYRKDIELDKKIIKILKKQYEHVYFWPQGSKDRSYLIEELGSDSVTEINDILILEESLAAFDTLLQNGEVDYVGTRLHAGIRALQKSKRSIIIGVDNRAIEMQKDINLPVVRRERVEELDRLIEEEWQPELNIPWCEIKKWKAQFL
ncbi:polysaccharide pyruvyl transferase family protein [Psychrobacter sp. AOP22-C1-22]|uniref:polysaccharide pyruvyl transferase family protein n=1 Tax=unclassified Psychrobacter TaxID=196806 RepID=UPI001CE3DEC6|nr:polysaccharide pyruvyl transferase family protein [Psychrobacter sp. FME6]